MTEKPPNPELSALQGQLAGIVAAMNMHVKRSEELASEAEQVVFEISQLTPGAQG